jgi:hypothetical protein
MTDSVLIDKACWERGCPCHDVGDEAVEVVRASDMSQERVDETTKHRHEEKNT